MLGTLAQTVHFGGFKAIKSAKPKPLLSNGLNGIGAEMMIFDGAAAGGGGGGKAGTQGAGAGGKAGTHGTGCGGKTGTGNGAGGGGGGGWTHGITGAGVHNTCGAGTTACGTHEHGLLTNGGSLALHPMHGCENVYTKSKQKQKFDYFFELCDQWTNKFLPAICTELRKATAYTILNSYFIQCEDCRRFNVIQKKINAHRTESD